MQAVLLRPARCLFCGGSMSSVGRIDRRYCKESCRTLAYRHRKRTGEPAKRRERIPKWTEGQPLVIGSALAALADLQGRIVQMAHHLEKDDIAFRHPYPVERSTKDAPDAARRIAELEAELRQTRADKIDAETRAETMSEELTQAQSRITRLLERVQNSSAKLEKTEQTLSRKNATRESSSAAMKDATRATARMRQDLERASKQLELSNQKIKALEDKVANHQSLTEELRAAQRANQTLKAEVERLRPPPAEADPLVKLMKQKVVAWHLLAQYEVKYQRKNKSSLFATYPGGITTHPLDREDPETILEAAVHAAHEARRGFFYRAPGPYAPKPKWIFDDRLLDPASEKALYEEEEQIVDRLRGYVNIGKIHFGS